MIAIVAGLLAAVFALSWWLTGRLRAYALRRQLVDVPNARSSHSVTTPRGGGMAIVVSVLAALPILGGAGLLPWPAIAALAGSGAVVATIGFIDDHGHVPAPWRLAAHFVAAWWVLASFGGPPDLPDPFPGVSSVWLVLGSLYVVWVLNLTNFMDGIDGVAAVETVTVCVGGVALYWLAGPLDPVAVVPLVLAAATAGFLVWNWPPAVIFMGDAGSGFLGLMLAALSLQAGERGLPLLCGWVILLGVFITDATVTLVRRAARGDRLHEAHRTHAYQHAARRYGAHKPVTLAVAAINVFWLLPVAAAVVKGLIPPASGVALAYTPLLAAALWLGAGTPQPPSPMSAHGIHS